VSRRKGLLLVLAALLSAGGYLWGAWARGASGFPLDDAWIHQVYARNLGTRGEFAFFEGQPSAGSTSPLWTLLLSFGYWLNHDFRVWTYLLGITLFAASALITARLVTLPGYGSCVVRLAERSFIIPLFLLFEWHLAWSAASGMEILLFIFLSLLLLERFYARERGWILGVLTGFLTLTRPEGLVLAALVGMGLLGQTSEPQRHEEGQEKKSDSRRTMGVWAVQFGGGIGLVLTPYLLFNLATSSTLFPNTFYAKSAEYAELFARTPFIVRWLELLGVPFVGAQILLVPGLIYGVIVRARGREWRALIPFAWILMLPALYAFHLPVAYQHGRYEMPIIPFIVMYGIEGTAALWMRVRNFVLRATWTLATAATLVAFWVIGAVQYSADVAIIDCEMVQTARWVAANAPADTVVAAHDIGALGYFYERPFIDLAGLVSPEVIPFLRDEDRLRDYLFSRRATFVVVFPEWYPAFDADRRFVPAYQTTCAVTRAAGERNMIVYRIVR
jgi:hypothetical protein